MFAVRRWLVGVSLFALLLVGVRGTGAEARLNLADSEARLRRDIIFLASDECEGRGPMTQGIEKAADYIAAEFKKAGLKPGGVAGTWFQPFPLAASILEAPARLSLKGPNGREIVLKQGVQFWPMGLSHAGRDTAGVVFAGYGITSDKAHYDDYAGIDATDKVVVVVRGFPQFGDREIDPQLQGGATFTAKAKNAEKHHAAALLVVNDREMARTGDDLLEFNYTALEGRSQAAVPIFHVRREVAEMMLGSRDDLEQIEQAISRDRKPQSRALPGWKVSFEARIKRGEVTLRNVVGILEGNGPLAKETIVVGAHYDHLGYGSRSSLSASRKPAIHHGADDNGSGTTTIMELARRFAAHPDRQGRRLVFIAFSGEEIGLNGSVYYCKKPLFPLDQTAAMYNVDMVGRLRPDKQADKDGNTDKLLTEGSGTSKAFPNLLAQLGKKHGFKLSNKASGYGPSDHDSFCRKKIPVLFVWTGFHDDYHRPTDTSDKINVPGMRKIVELSEEAVTALATMPKPEYIAVKEPSIRPTAGGPRLGIRPSYGDDDEGVLIDGVAEGLPAAKAGMKEGDRIMEISGKKVKSLETYMEILSTQKKGDTIEVTIVRSGKPMKLQVRLE
jgi:hypothetical protein